MRTALANAGVRMETVDEQITKVLELKLVAPGLAKRGREKRVLRERRTRWWTSGYSG